MRVFLDTNVLVSAFSTRGLSADVFRLVIAQHTLVVAEVVLQELMKVLRKKIGLTKEGVEEIVALLREYEVVPKPKSLPNISLRDPDDLLVLASAINAKVDILVTGDGDLLAIAENKLGITITDPRGFWELAKGNRNAE